MNSHFYYPDPFQFSPHDITWLDRPNTSRGSGHNDVSRIERIHTGSIFNQLADIINEVAGV